VVGGRGGWFGTGLLLLHLYLCRDIYTIGSNHRNSNLLCTCAAADLINDLWFWLLAV
jgi:hypothetical protein